MVVTENGGVDLVVIPGGTFQMGSPADVGYPDEHPRHRVNVSPFHMGRYPVTNEEYARFRAANPDVEEPPWWSDRRFNGARQPVVGVTWEEACRFAGWVGGRLPTEAQWEYAARAGTTTSHWWADQPGNNRANFAGSGSEWSGDRTSPVDAFEANPFGLHDVHGNVWEWVLDCWHADYERAPGDGSAWDAGDGGDCSRRVLRGGSWYDDMGYARAAYRRGPVPDYPDGRLGFRVVLSSLIS